MVRHRVFISYHHDNDQDYKEKFVKLFDCDHDIFIDGSVRDGDIDDTLKTETIRQRIRDEYLRDTTVTIVLIGRETWKRKHIDWEISSSIRDTEFNPRSGLLGIILPTHPDYGKGSFTPSIVPPRLYDNVKKGFAKIYNWTNDPLLIERWIETAFRDRKKNNPDNSRQLFGKNRTGDHWVD
ncbi:MAG: TIR domain-containing protein [Treponema sp.]